MAKKNDLIIVNLAWALFAGFACFSRHQGLSFFDASEFATHIRGGGIPHAPGYPLYILLAKALFFVPDPFAAQFYLGLMANLLTTNLLYLTLTCRTQNRVAALLTVLFFLCGVITRTYLVVPDVFQLSLALLAAVIYCHQRLWQDRRARWVFGIGAIYGLAICHQHIMALGLPASLLLFLRRPPHISWLKIFIPGFLLGSLPLLYLYYAGQGPWNYTYFAVSSWSDLVFILFRRGYGTLQMTASSPAVRTEQVIRLIGVGLSKNLSWPGFVVALVVLPAYYKAQVKNEAMVLYSTLTMICFVGLFSLTANFNPTQEEARNAFLRYTILPSFLLLFPLNFACELGLRFSRWCVLVVVLPLCQFANSVQGLNFKNYPLIDFQVEQAFAAIGQVVKEKDVGDLSYRKCVIFAVDDALHFGGRYFNEFGSPFHCYFFSLSTVITHQFLGRAEANLLRRYRGSEFMAERQSREQVLSDFFKKMSATGFRVFFLFPPDAGVFKDAQMNVVPFANIGELQVVGKSELPGNLMAEYLAYLRSIDKLLLKLDMARSRPYVLSETVFYAPFYNLSTFPAYTNLVDKDRELETSVQERARKFIQQSVPASL